MTNYLRDDNPEIPENIREEIASRYWAGCANTSRVAKGEFSVSTMLLPEDFKEQKMIDKHPYYNFADQILSIPKLAQGLEAVEKGYNAKVNRGARLPNFWEDDFWEKLKAGWVKEVK